MDKFGQTIKSITKHETFHFIIYQYCLVIPFFPDYIFDICV